MDQEFISGIQQIGIGVCDADKSLRRYASLFGMNTLVFADEAEATLMTAYTGGKAHRRQAALALNMQGGGGFEIWQFKDRMPQHPAKPPRPGDLGIYAAKLKSPNVEAAYKSFQNIPDIIVSPLLTDPEMNKHFFVCDEQMNQFNIVQGHHWFQNKQQTVGGVAGAVIGVRNMESSLKFYKWLLNLETVVYDVKDEQTRRVLLRKMPSGKGAFGNLLGSVEIELVQMLHDTPEKIFRDRYWGDKGFIHLCFDVFDMCGLQKHAAANGYNFTVDSQTSFDMDLAAGRFCYLEDPDGTLIELVETHKVPILKKLGIYLDLKKRNLEKPLPHWMIRMLSLSRVK